MKVGGLKPDTEMIVFDNKCTHSKSTPSRFKIRGNICGPKETGRNAKPEPRPQRESLLARAVCSSRFFRHDKLQFELANPDGRLVIAQTSKSTGSTGSIRQSTGVDRQQHGHLRTLVLLYKSTSRLKTQDATFSV